MRKIEHLGIAVKDLQKSNDLFKRLLGSAHYKTESVEGEGVKTSFFQIGDTKIELLEATRPDSPIAKFLDKKQLPHDLVLLISSKQLSYQLHQKPILLFSLYFLKIRLLFL